MQHILEVYGIIYEYGSKQLLLCFGALLGKTKYGKVLCGSKSAGAHIMNALVHQ